MKRLLIGINAKFIHPNMAIRLLKANTTYDVDIMEFNIKTHVDTIVDFILENQYGFVGFSCYIWNIEMIKEILPILKSKNITILLGGPEVSYNARYYIDNNLADYVIKNEGEEAFDLLLKYLEGKIDINSVPNLYYKDGYTFDKLVDIKNIKMAYDLIGCTIDKQIMYIETSRGCPYHCSYCMGGLDNKLRFFDLEEVKRNLLYLINRGAKIFKFLDRTFNAHKKNFIELIDFICENHKENNSFQFEITGDLLDEDIINYINTKAPKGLFRFEIGIQSTNKLANEAVYRIQNNEKLFKNIRLIQDAKVIDLHLDLIAGLPKENYASFKNTFNEVLSLRPKELQLGFLKLLKGTRLYKDKDMYGYVFNEKAPYDIVYNDFMSVDDIKNIHIAEDAFEIYYNKDTFKKSINYILDCVDNHYDFFFEIGKLYPREKDLKGKFVLLDEFVKNIPSIDYYQLHKLLILDYLDTSPYKPSCWWVDKISPKDKNELLREYHQNGLLDYSLHDLYTKSLVINMEHDIILVMYNNNQKKIHIFIK